MSREVSIDSKKLVEFFKNYNIESQFLNTLFETELKSMHKKIYGFLLFVMEVEYQNSQESFIEEKSLFYLKESSSDMMQALFCWVNGAYKPAELMLRSSIETYLKAVIGNTFEEIYNEKSMYKIFDLAKVHSFFSSDISNKSFATIHNNYKILCMTAHTADINKLSSLTTMRLLPMFNGKQSKAYTKLFINTLDAMLASLFNNYYSKVYSMHPMNLSAFVSTIPLAMKKEIHEYHLTK